MLIYLFWACTKNAHNLEDVIALAIILSKSGLCKKITNSKTKSQIHFKNKIQNNNNILFKISTNEFNLN